MNVDYILPIEVSSISGFAGEFILFVSDNVSITIRPFSDEEKRKLLGVINYSNDGGRRMIHTDSHYVPRVFQNDLAFASYKIVVSFETQEEEDFRISSKYFNYECDLLDFLFRVCVQIPIPLRLIVTNSNKQGGGNYDNHIPAFFHIESFSVKELTIIKNLFEKALSSEQKVKVKVDLLKSLYKIVFDANSSQGLRCSTLVSIIESFLTSDDEKSEVLYRVSIRLTKFLSKDYYFNQEFKKLYGKRSSYYHKGKSEFTDTDFTTLFQIATKCVTDFILNPDVLTAKSLDCLLLK